MPKPMVEIGGRPLLWHLLKYYDHFGFCDFVIALGYLGDCIRRYFHHNVTPASDCGDWEGRDVLLRESDGELAEHWRVELIETGLDTATGGRIKRLAPMLGNDTFMLTWSDGLADVDLHSLLDFHRSHDRLATVTAVRPPSRFGRLTLNGDRVTRFAEKQNCNDEWINGAFFVLEPEVFEYIEGDHTSWEHEPMERLAADGQLMAYRHRSFWRCVDTQQEREELDQLWSRQRAPWKNWTDPPETEPRIIPFRPRKRRVLVTGHDSYIGKILVPRLLDAGYEVTGLDSGL
jgi:glucose-1-phosphate cytidylyltransferase